MFSIKFARWSMFSVSFFWLNKLLLKSLSADLGLTMNLLYLISYIDPMLHTRSTLLFPTSYVSCNAFAMPLDIGFFYETAGSFTCSSCGDTAQSPMHSDFTKVQILQNHKCTSYANTAQSFMYLLAVQILQDHWCTWSAKIAKSLMYFTLQILQNQQCTNCNLSQLSILVAISAFAMMFLLLLRHCL